MPKTFGFATVVIASGTVAQTLRGSTVGGYLVWKLSLVKTSGNFGAHSPRRAALTLVLGILVLLCGSGAANKYTASEA
eukprot:6907350-Pyramimonas_sp.AAC.1